MLEYINIDTSNYEIMLCQMTDYYRNAEDADTPQQEIEDFIHMLFDMIQLGSIRGKLLYYDNVAVGFVLWGIDKEDDMFCEMPGYGTILEICVNEDCRMNGIGTAAVNYAEADMLNNGAKGLYVLAHPDAQGFWQRLGYIDSGNIGGNKLPVCIKAIE